MVAGHLQEKKGYYYIVLSYKNDEGKRKTKWLPTKLTVKGNKKRAERMLQEARRDFVPEGIADPENIGDGGGLFRHIAVPRGSEYCHNRCLQRYQSAGCLFASGLYRSQTGRLQSVLAGRPLCLCHSLHHHSQCVAYRAYGTVVQNVRRGDPGEILACCTGVRAGHCRSADLCGGGQSLRYRAGEKAGG